ncbi:MAG: hypothetical protein AAF456_10895 [Planctomycetota bacterium]
MKSQEIKKKLKEKLKPAYDCLVSGITSLGRNVHIAVVASSRMPLQIFIQVSVSIIAAIAYDVMFH